MGGIHQQSSTYGWFMVVYCCFTSIESTTCAQAASFPGPTASLHLVPNVHPILHLTKDFQHSLYTAKLYLIPDGLGTVGYASRLSCSSSSTLLSMAAIFGGNFLNKLVTSGASRNLLATDLFAAGSSSASSPT